LSFLCSLEYFVFETEIVYVYWIIHWLPHDFFYDFFEMQKCALFF
jgi:hypothetical protein